MRVLLASCVLLIAAFHAQVQPVAQVQLVPVPSTPPSRATVQIVEKEIWIPVPESFPHGLDALLVYADLPGRHPLAVLTHGTSDVAEVRMRLTPWAQLGQALWFARRGYVAIVVVRRGYGRSGGEQDGKHSACHGGGSFEEIGENSADDLRAVIKYAADLPQVDAGIVVSAGVSTGGFAQAALVANPPQGLKAAISFAGGRGGDGHEHNCDLSGVVGAFESFGKASRKHGDVPMLWIYSENDHWFPPPFARQFEAAFTKGGGAEQFVLAPPDGEDGHHLYSHPAAWSDTVQTFLKAHDLLPLGDEVLPAPEVLKSPPPPGLHEDGEKAWNDFLAGAPFKAFATDGEGAWGDAQAGFDQGIADNKAIENCKKRSSNKRGCQVVANTPRTK